jgi:hypothetical protein
MNPGNLLKAALVPVTEFTVVLPLVLFAILSALGLSGGPMGILLLVLLLPPVFRFQMLVMEASAKGVAAEPLDAENFSFTGSGWALFPLPMVVFIAWATFAASQRFGDGAATLVLMIAAVLLPASLAVLVVTRSPLQSLSPVAIARLIRTCIDTFWIAPLYLVVVGWLCLQVGELPALLMTFVPLVLTFSFFSLTGALIEPYGLLDDVYIPDAIEPDEKEVLSDIEKSRVAALAHAYGFVSRDNRKGGFEHVFGEIEKDPDPAGAWAWYLDRMLGWENGVHALFFAQHYVHDALRHGEDVNAVKVIMRCRMLDENFRPLPEDLPAALEAAEKTGNIELAAVLNRG